MSELTTTHEHPMGTKPIMGLLIRMSIPAILSMLIQSLYNIVDSYFVALIDERAFRAVSLVFPYQMIMISIGVGTGIGVNSLIARRLGEQRQEKANRAAAQGVLLAFVSYIVIGALGFLISEPFLGAFTSDAQVYADGVIYMRIVGGFSIGLFMQCVLEKTIQGSGNMIYPMIAQILGAGLNMVLDPIFIFGWFGIPAFGVAGAAIATVIAQCIGATLCILFLWKGNLAIRISKSDLRWHRQTTAEIYRVALPSIVMQMLTSVLTLGLNQILIRFSEVAVSVLGAYYKLQSFVFMPVFGLMQGVMPIIGYNYGARNKKRIDKVLRYGTLAAVGIMALGFILFQWKARELLMIFNATEEMLKIGIPALRIISTCFIPAALGIIASTFFQALGIGKYSLMVSLLRQIVLILPLALALSLLGLQAIWYAFPLAEVGSFLFSMIFFRRIYRLQIAPMPQESESKVSEKLIDN